jgi:hypothetical protein
MSNANRFHALQGAKPATCPACQIGSVTETIATIPAAPGLQGELRLVTVRAWTCNGCPWCAIEHRPVRPEPRRCPHPGAAGPCEPRLSDGRCIWCERPMLPARPVPLVRRPLRKAVAHA